jgi:hypothetical protein
VWQRDFIRIDPAYEAALEACGLTRVDAILARTDGRVVAWSRSTETMHIPGPDGQPGFYLKRYYYPSWRKRLELAFRGTFLGAHRGLSEFVALQALRLLGIPAARPVAYGARRVGHFVVACFLITEEVPRACNLTTFARHVRDGRRLVSLAQKRQMIRGLAAGVAAMHAAGFFHGQLFWRNILIRQNPDGTAEFFFLDAHPRWRLRAGRNGWKRELGQLACSATPFTSRTDRLRFLRAYAQADRLTPQLKQQAREIATLAETWRHHERRRIKMDRLFEEWNRLFAAECWQVAASSAGSAK